MVSHYLHDRTFHPPPLFLLWTLPRGLLSIPILKCSFNPRDLIVLLFFSVFFFNHSNSNPIASFHPLASSIYPHLPWPIHFYSHAISIHIYPFIAIRIHQTHSLDLPTHTHLAIHTQPHAISLSPAPNPLIYPLRATSSTRYASEYALITCSQLSFYEIRFG